MLRDVLVRRRWPRHAGPALRPLEQPSGRLLPRAGRHLLSAKQPATISRLESRLSADTTTFLSCARCALLIRISWKKLSLFRSRPCSEQRVTARQYTRWNGDTLQIPQLVLRAPHSDHARL